MRGIVAIAPIFAAEFAVPAVPQDGTDWALIASIAVAAAAVAGLALREWQRSRENLDAKVQQAVNAAIGSTFHQFREIEASVRAEISDAISEGSAKLRTEAEHARSLASRLETDRAQLDELLPIAGRLGELLERAEGILPSFDSSIPIILLQQAKGTTDYLQKTALLTQMLEVADAPSEELETAGDIARQELGNNSLAESLYKAAVDADPSRLSSRAEYLAIRIRRGGPEASGLLSELTDLANTNLGNRYVIARLFDMYIQADQYEQLRDFCLVALEARPDSGILWRNLAIALRQVGTPAGEVIAAFAKALAAGRTESDGIVNTIRPYASYLVSKVGDLDGAEELVLEGLRAEPREAQLYIILAKIYVERRDRDTARQLLQLAVKYGNPRESFVAEEELRGIEAFERLQELIPTLSESILDMGGPVWDDKGATD